MFYGINIGLGRIISSGVRFSVTLWRCLRPHYQDAKCAYQQHTLGTSGHHSTEQMLRTHLLQSEARHCCGHVCCIHEDIRWASCVQCWGSLECAACVTMRTIMTAQRRQHRQAQITATMRTRMPSSGVPQHHLVFCSTIHAELLSDSGNPAA